MNDFFGDAKPTTQSFEAQAAQIYEAYPVRVGRPYAIQCIIKQLKVPSQGFEWLLRRTKEFAAAVGDRREFIPHPSTWFNQQRFNDDPITWTRRGGISELKTQLENVEKLIGSHPANPESANYSSRCNGIQKDELNDLKRKRMTVIKAIANY